MAQNALPIKIPIYFQIKIQFYEFVGNVNAVLGLPWFCYRTRFDASRPNFRSKKGIFFEKRFFWFFDKSADMADFHKKNVGESCVWIILTRIHDIGHIHMVVFSQSQFPTSPPPQKNGHFRTFHLYVFVKIFGLWVKIRNFWVPNKTC